MSNWSNQHTICPDDEGRIYASDRCEKELLQSIIIYGDAIHSAKEVSGSQYDIERLGWKIDVKTKPRTVYCRDWYTTDTQCYQDEFDCDIYAFASFHEIDDHVEFMGWEWKDDYLAAADYVAAGELHDGRVQKMDGHKMQYKHLRDMQEFEQVMSGEFWLVKSKDQIEDRLNHFKKYLETEWNWENAIQWKVARFTGRRSLSQSNLFHMWCGEMADHFAERGADVDKERMKLMLKNKFLGTEDVLVGSTTIPGQVRHTSNLSPGEMCDFMDQVQNWALDNGVTLTCPADSEYMRLKGG